MQNRKKIKKWIQPKLNQIKKQRLNEEVLQFREPIFKAKKYGQKTRTLSINSVHHERQKVQKIGRIQTQKIISQIPRTPRYEPSQYYDLRNNWKIQKMKNSILISKEMKKKIFFTPKVEKSSDLEIIQQFETESKVDYLQIEKRQKTQSNSNHIEESGVRVAVNIGKSKQELVSMRNIDESMEIIKNQPILGLQSQVFKIQESLIQPSCKELSLKLSKIMKQKNEFYKIMSLPQEHDNHERELFLERYTNFMFQLQKIDDKYENLTNFYGLNHPNAIKIFKHFRNLNKILFLKEPTLGFHTLQKLIKNRQINFTQFPEIIRQIVKFVCYLRSKKLYHGQLFPHHIKYGNKIVKINKIQNCKKIEIQRQNPFLPPERNEPQKVLYTDIWSLGILTFYFYRGKAPSLKEIEEGNYSQVTPLEARKFIKDILIKEDKNRIKIEELVAHQYLELAERNIQMNLFGFQKEIIF